MKQSNVVALIIIIAVGVALHRSGCTLIDFRPKASLHDKTPIDTSADPVQVNLPQTEETPIIMKIDGKQTILLPRADYKIAGRVVSKRHYYKGWYAKLAPVDLAIAWGSIATHDYDKYLSFDHSDRYYNYSYTRELPLDGAYVALHSANEHMIPANGHIEKALKSVKVDEIVEVEGFLVNAEGEGSLTTSLVRDDKGEGACEIVYVKRLRIGDEVFK